MLANRKSLKTWMIVYQSMMEYDTTSETWTLEKDYTVFILIYIWISEVDLRCPATYKIEFFETIIIGYSR